MSEKMEENSRRGSNGVIELNQMIFAKLASFSTPSANSRDDGEMRRTKNKIKGPFAN